jgi:hypothetical protein
MAPSVPSRTNNNTNPTQVASGQASRRPAGRNKARRPAPGQARVAGDARRSTRDPGRVVIELECGITVYPPEEAGAPWRATFTENGRRRFRQGATEAELAARLEKVTERLQAGAPDMERPGADLIAYYLDPDRLPPDKRWSRKHWAPRHVGDELRQVRAAAWNARLAAIRASAQAKAASGRGQHHTAARQHELADSYHALHQAYRQREAVFAAVMADRADWDAATCAQRHLAVAADAELRRRHPDQHYPPLRSAEPQPAIQTQRDELTLTAGQPIPEMGQWIKDLAAGHRTFAGTLAERHSLTVPSQDPDYAVLGQAFPPWPRPARDAILQPPKPEISPCPQVLQRAADRDADREATD